MNSSSKIIPPPEVDVPENRREGMIRMVPDESWGAIQTGVNHAAKLLANGYTEEAKRVLGEIKHFTDDAF